MPYIPGELELEPMLVLANNIRDNVLTLNDFFAKNSHPIPTFSAKTAPNKTIIPPTSPGEIQDARSALIIAFHAFLCLVANSQILQANDTFCMQVIHRYQIAQCFSPSETITFEELSSRCGLNVIDLKRVLRLVMTRHVFAEPKAGFVAHTAATRLLRDDDRIRAFSGIIAEERFPASAKGFSLANDTELGLYEELQTHPAREKRWNLAMSAMAARIDFDFILNNSALSSLEPGSLFVDVGGGNGTISIGLAERLPHVHFLIQDAAPNAHAQSYSAKGTASQGDDRRVTWQKHDFFTPQTVVGDTYYFRNIFHNWPDSQCVKILQQHLPVLRPKTRIIIDDFALHEPLTVPPFEERKTRSMDVTMLVYFGSHERTIAQWQGILAEADPRFTLEKVTQDPKQPNTILQVVFG
ncbi:S-adenosyl-L-methionine-dependent methyltransferase [Penicillium angulare]|uniref:S-adenosyl-L-methionine-dependent methyltransferase n=1 Tax=Penicillium angulare TaxID=116970 RepID=A0A9W9KBT6_9EURO|nr:S-adenosyl-L-methionine-dependent methyltransferase [Penicillium angulare]